MNIHLEFTKQHGGQGLTKNLSYLPSKIDRIQHLTKSREILKSQYKGSYASTPTHFQLRHMSTEQNWKSSPASWSWKVIKTSSHSKFRDKGIKSIAHTPRRYSAVWPFLGNMNKVYSLQIDPKGQTKETTPPKSILVNWRVY